MTSTDPVPKRKHRATPRIEASYMQVKWAQTQIRFHEDQQLIDVVDTLSVIYKTKETAGVKQASFLSPANIAKTAELCKCDPGSIIHKLVWSDAARERTCVAVLHMHLMLTTLKGIPNAAELAAILDVGKLTVATAHRFDDANTPPTATAGEVEATESGATFTLTRSEAFAHANSRLVEHTANEWLRVTNMETAARQEQLTMEQLKRRADAWDIVQDLESNKRKRVTDEECNKLQLKIQCLRKLGETTKADKLLGQLLELN